MAGTIKVTLPDGRVVDGVEVGVDESTERWSDVKLTDGTVLRVKLSIISAVRTEVFDPQGNPTYSLNMAPVMAVVDVPSRWKRNGS